MHISVHAWAVTKEAGWCTALLPSQPHCLLVLCFLTNPGQYRYLRFPDVFKEAQISAENTDKASVDDQELDLSKLLRYRASLQSLTFHSARPTQSFPQSQEAKNDNPRSVVIEYIKTLGRSLRQRLPESTRGLKPSAYFAKKRKKVSEKCPLNFCNPLRARM